MRNNKENNINSRDEISNQSQRANQRTSSTKNNYISYLDQRAHQRVESDSANYYRNNANQNSNPRTSSDTTNNYSSNQNQRETQITNSASVNESHVETNNASSNCNGMGTTNNAYRPNTSKQNNNNIIFKNIESPADKLTSNKHSSADVDLKGLHDAFTGAPLDESLGLNQCQTCKVYYHTSSVRILRDENNSKCASCKTANIIKVVIDNIYYTPNIVYLTNYKNHVDKVVTFVGQVCQVNSSYKNSIVALMFENKPYLQSFKLIFLNRNSLNKAGGIKYVESLVGKTINTSGFIVNNQRFGYHMIYKNQSSNQRTNDTTINDLDSNTYTPTACKQNNSNITFRSTEFTPKKANNKHKSNDLDLKGLNDAFTGATLNKSLGLHQCQTCKAYYHTASVHILDDENNSKCVACQAATIIKVVVNKKATGKDYAPSTANSRNNKNGKVVTFKGFVRKLKRISAGYSAVFMGDSELVLLWKNSIKRDNEMRYITSIVGKTVIVRGLLEYGEFGYQIIISKKSMILGIS